MDKPAKTTVKAKINGIQYFINPYARIAVLTGRENNDNKIAFIVPSKKNKFCVTMQLKSPELTSILLKLISSNHNLTMNKIDDKLLNSLTRASILIKDKKDIPQRTVFKCLITDETKKLLPTKIHYNYTTDTDILQTNPSLSISKDINGGLRELGDQDLINSDLPRITVRDELTGLTYLYHLSSKYYKLVKQLKKREFPPANLRDPDKQILQYAGVLTRKGTSQATNNETIKEASSSINKHSYAVLRNIFNPLELYFVKEYIKKRMVEGFLTLGDKLCKTRYKHHNEPVSRFFHPKLENFVSRIVGEKVKASYTYTIAYLKNATLPNHRDRDVCKWTLSLQVEHYPNQEKLRSTWPIYLELSKGKYIPIHLGEGDCLIYSGSKMRHYRKKLTQRRRCTLILFHFVPINYKGSLD